MIRKVILTSLLLAVASAGAVTVQHLSTTPKVFSVCGGAACSARVHCLVPLCTCNIKPGQLSGTCVQTSNPPVK
jgi:hypothetical protein